jgi:osmotically-inducible protein OsmY
MNKPNGVYRDNTNEEIYFIDLNQPITALLASPSKFFLEGINRVLQNEKGIIIVWLAHGQEEIEKNLERIKPDILFIDNRTLKFDVPKILPLINSDTKLILLGDRSTAELGLPNVTYLTRHTSSSELILAMRKSLYRSMAINIEEYKPSAISNLTPSNMDEPETIIDLTDEVLFEEGDEIKLFDDEIGLEENIHTIDHEFDHLDHTHYHRRKRDVYPRVWSLRQFSLFLLLAFGAIYFGTKYIYPNPDLSFISSNLFRPTDPKIESEIKMALSERGFPHINVSVDEGKAVLSGKVQSEEDYNKASMIVKAVKGVKDIESHLVVENMVTHGDSIPDIEETEFHQHKLNDEQEKENDEKASHLNNDKNEQSNEPVLEKQVAYSRSIPKAEVIQPIQRETSQDREQESNSKISSPIGKKGTSNRPAVEKEANESRRLQVLSELENEVRRKDVVEVIRGQDQPRELEYEERVSALLSTIDASIARDIEKALADEGYENIKVSVENGEVFLIGEVKTHQEHIRLHRIALRTNGVKKVKSVLGISEYNMQ